MEPIKVTRKFILNFIALAVLVGILYMLGEATAAKTIFGTTGFFDIKTILNNIYFGVTTPLSHFNLYFLITYTFPAICALFIILCLILMVVRNKWMPLFYCFWLLILGGGYLIVGSVIYSYFINADGAFVLAKFTQLWDAACFKNIDFKTIDFSQQAQLISALQTIGYDLILWILAICIVVNLFVFLNTGSAYVSKANRRKIDYTKQNAAPQNYYYVSNYYTQPGTAPYTTRVTPAYGNSTNRPANMPKSNKEKGSKYYYPKVK
ncbi:MAG: hypothetical protein SOV26_01370 [Candidatus Onthovivens sp.]|nr:hypothetical protein [Candidatus Onthovivens sp.]